jgi:hypothetical protein
MGRFDDVSDDDLDAARGAATSATDQALAAALGDRAIIDAFAGLVEAVSKLDAMLAERGQGVVDRHSAIVGTAATHMAKLSFGREPGT